jgi:hypothetical protein
VRSFAVQVWPKLHCHVGLQNQTHICAARVRHLAVAACNHYSVHSSLPYRHTTVLQAHVSSSCGCQGTFVSHAATRASEPTMNFVLRCSFRQSRVDRRGWCYHAATATSVQWSGWEYRGGLRCCCCCCCCTALHHCAASLPAPRAQCWHPQTGTVTMPANAALLSSNRTGM